MSRSKADRGRDGPSLDSEEPYWFLLPRWLSISFRDSKQIEGVGGALLENALSAQYCLFLAIRVEDDLFDGQAKGASLPAVIRQLLIESDNALRGRFQPDSPIWQIKARALETSRDAIAAIDKLQQVPGAMGGEALGGYSRVSEVLKVGIAAICVAASRMTDYFAVGAFCDHLAIAGQIIDDLEDLEEDFERGRYNYACNTLLAFSDSWTGCPGDARDAIAKSFVRGDGVRVLLDEAKKHLEIAAAAIAPLGLPQIGEYVGEAIRETDLYLTALHRARVNLLFGHP